MVYLKVICKDSSLVDSTAIVIKKKLILPQKSLKEFTENMTSEEIEEENSPEWGKNGEEGVTLAPNDNKYSSIMRQ